MGIVVTLAMLIGLVVLRPTPWRTETHLSAPLGLLVSGGLGLLLLGIWNIGYGLQRLAEFWGWAALLSGLVMVSAAILIVALYQQQSSPQVWKILTYRTLITLSLAICFLLYSVTLVQLNLGFPIIG